MLSDEEKKAIKVLNKRLIDECEDYVVNKMKELLEKE